MAAVYKAFVVKNGLEVSTDLILADANTRKVGIATTAIQYTLHVNGGIGATDLYVIGIGTFANELNVGLGGTILTVLGVGNSIGVGTANPAFLLDIRSPVSTGQTALYVQGDIQVTGDLNIDDISITNLNVSGVSTFVGFATFNNILVAGISTFVGFTTFRSNILVAGIGTITTLNSTNANITNLNVSGVSTFVGFATFNNILVAGISTFVGLSTFNNLNSQNLNISGISTLNNVFLGGYLSVGGTTGQQNQVLVSTGVGVTWRPNSSLRTSTSFIATPGQTSFSATYSIGFVDVYINGVKLINTEFTATNGTSVVLNDSCFGSESVEIIAFNVEYPLTFSGITLQEEGSVVGTGIDAINFVGAAVTAVSVGAGSTIFVNAQLPLTSSSNVVVGIITATGGFVSTANTTPVTIQLVGNQLTFNAVGIGSTTLTLF